MPPAVVKLVALLLLFVQGAIALVPGRMICIPVQDCGTHEREAAVACGHCDSVGFTDTAGSHTGHSHGHGPFSLVVHPVDECGCHVHIPLPNDEQLSTNPRCGNPELKTLAVPLVITYVLNWNCNPPRVMAALVHPPDFSASDQVRALETIRLLI